jgi:4-amino-4-deoxy-L-arabinose transferase-like glycosyltransferase
VAAVLAASLVARLLYVLAAPLPAISADSAGYDAAAERLVRTGTFAYPILAFEATGPIRGAELEAFLSSPSNAYTMPGYTVFLAGIWKVVADPASRLAWARVLQALLGTASLLLLYLVARRALDEKAAMVALVAAAAYPPFIWATGQLLTETLYTTAMLGFVLSVLIALDSDSVRGFAIAGLLLGVSALVRPLAVVWVVVLVAYMLIARVLPWRRVALLVGTLGIAFCLVMAPWWVRNAMRYGRFVPLTTCGANPLAAATSPSYVAGQRPKVDYPPDLLADDYALGQYWQKVADAQIADIWRSDPLGYARIKSLNARYALIHFWPDGPGAGLDSTLMRRYSRLALYLLYALGLVGLALRRRESRLWLVASLPLYFVAAHLATLFLNRYLYPAMWVWVVPAAAGAVALWELAARGVERRRAS